MSANKTPIHPHAGHRQRLRARFTQTGLEGFADHEVLELILSFAIPQKDTNETAHKLLNTFGSLPAVFYADKEDLKKVAGVGDISACLLCMFAPVARRLFSQIHEETYLKTSAQAARYVSSLLFGKKSEHLYLICLDASYRVLHKCIIAEGSIDTVPVYVRNIAAIALQHNTTHILLAHNHPSGNVYPSRQDIQVTTDLLSALAPLDIRLRDHIIVSGQQYYSFADKQSHTHQLLPENEALLSDNDGISYL